MDKATEFLCEEMYLKSTLNVLKIILILELK